jgi:hypothetical protein
MRAAIRKPARQRPGLRPARRRRDSAAGPVRERPAPEPPVRRGEERERQAGGPQDRALYVCRCGSAFAAVVTASVRCPHCGDPQAW